jgi:hypothetical protein
MEVRLYKVDDLERPMDLSQWLLLLSTYAIHHHSTSMHLTPEIPWDQKLVDCCLGSLCEEKYFFFNFFF